MPRLPAPPPATEAAPRTIWTALGLRRAGVVQVAIWITAVVLYGLLGAWQPAVFVLGFWQSFPIVLGVTWVAGRVARRLGR